MAYPNVAVVSTVRNSKIGMSLGGKLIGFSNGLHLRGREKDLEEDFWLLMSETRNISTSVGEWKRNKLGRKHRKGSD